MEGTFWHTFSLMPQWVTIFWGVILTGAYWILRLLMQSIAVCICRVKKVDVATGLPLGHSLFKEKLDDQDS